MLKYNFRCWNVKIRTTGEGISEVERCKKEKRGGKEAVLIKRNSFERRKGKEEMEIYIVT